MSDLEIAKKAKDRSPNFPFISLEVAIERAKQFYAEEKRGAAPYLRAVRHWHYSPTSSGAMQTIGALKMYGLLAEIGSGSGDARQFQLTDLALRIILDQRPDSTERVGHIRAAALMPAISDEMYKNWADGIPSDATINHILVLEKKFNESNAVRVLRILKENHAFARMITSTSLSLPVKTETEEDSTIEDDVTDLTPVEIVNKTKSSTPGAMRPMAGTTMETVFLPEGKSLSVQFSDVPDLAAYEMLKSFVDWKISLFKIGKKTEKPTD